MDQARLEPIKWSKTSVLKITVHLNRHLMLLKGQTSIFTLTKPQRGLEIRGTVVHTSGTSSGILAPQSELRTRVGAQTGPEVTFKEPHGVKQRARLACLMFPRVLRGAFGQLVHDGRGYSENSVSPQISRPSIL